jgi:hypothetical protein
MVHYLITWRNIFGGLFMDGGVLGEEEEWREIL